MRSDSRLGIIGTAGVGAGLMFLLDPNMGGRRRAILRDKAISLAKTTAWAMDKTARDSKNRLYGTLASTKSKFSRAEVSDDILVDRIRSKIGRAVSHPSAIEVSVENGIVTLSGPVLSDEMNSLVGTVCRVKGVEDVDNQLEAHDEAGDVPSLQGGRSRRGSQFTLLQSNWPPAIRLLVGTAGIAAAAAGFKRGGIVGSILGGIGTSLIAGAVTNQGLRQMVSRAAANVGKQMPEQLRGITTSGSEAGTKQRTAA